MTADDRTAREIAHDELDPEELAQTYAARGWETSRDLRRREGAPQHTGLTPEEHGKRERFRRARRPGWFGYPDA